MRKCSICGCTTHDKRKHTSDEILVHNLIKSVITNALKTNKKNTKDEKNNKPRKSTKNALDNEKSCEEKFNSDIEYKKYIILKLKELGLEENDYNDYNNWTAYKSVIQNGIILSYTEYFKEYKNGTKESSPTSKSDIFIKNNITGEIIPISIKSGSARLTSADCYESNALFNSVLYKSTTRYYESTSLARNVKKIIDIMKNIGKWTTLSGYNYTVVNNCIKCNNINEDLKPTVQWLENYEEKTLEMNNIWEDIKKQYPNYIEDLKFECARGWHKFGKNNSRADYLIELESSTSTEVINIYNLKEKNDKIKSYLKKHGNGNVFKIKSSGVQWWSRFL